MFSNSNENVTQILGLNGLNLGLQDMYMDTNTLSTTSIASTGNTPPTSPLSPEPMLPFDSSTNGPSLLQEHQQQQQHQPHLNTVLSAAFKNAIIPDQNTLQNALYIQQQNQFRQLQQQQQNNQLQQQWALANATINHLRQHPDEISHSLKMYAMFSAYKSNSDANRHQLDVMQEFATNGQTSDDLHRHQSQAAANRSHIAASASQNLNLLSVAAHQSQNQFLQQLQAQTLINLNYPELNYASGIENFVWQRPSYAPPPKTLATKDPTQQPFMNSKFGIGSTNSFTSRSIATRNVKRYNAKEKFSSSKHCVFCENNNEPEAVIKSHSVRDSLGRVLCPKLRTYVCPICKDSGDMAHTVKYCPKKPIITMEDSIRAESFRLSRTNYYKQQMQV